MGMNLSVWGAAAPKVSLCVLPKHKNRSCLPDLTGWKLRHRDLGPAHGKILVCIVAPAGGLWGWPSAFQLPTGGAVTKEERNNSRIMPLSGQPISLNVHYKEKNKAASSLRSLVTPNHAPRRYGDFQKLVDVCFLCLTRIRLHQTGQPGHWATETKSTVAHSSGDPWCLLSKPGFSAHRITE